MLSCSLSAPPAQRYDTHVTTLFIYVHHIWFCDLQWLYIAFIYDTHVIHYIAICYALLFQQGSYQHSRGQSSCVSCDAGYYSSDHASVCLACATGLYSTGSASACMRSDTVCLVHVYHTGP